MEAGAFPAAMRVLIFFIVHLGALLDAGGLASGVSEAGSMLRDEDIFTHSEDFVVVAESHRRLLSARIREDYARRLAKKTTVAQEATCPAFDQSEIQSRGPLLVTVEVEKGRDLPKLKGSWGMKDIPDGYVTYEVKVGGETYLGRTEVIKNKVDPEWGFRCQFPVPEAVSEITIDGEVYDHNDGRPDIRIGTFKKKVRYKQALSGIDKEATLGDCSACKKPCVVSLEATWGTVYTPPGGKYSTIGKGGKGGFPWLWVILGALLVVGLVGGAVAYIMFSGSGTEVQHDQGMGMDPARNNALVGSEMQPHAHWQPTMAMPAPPQSCYPPPQQQYYQQPPPQNYQQPFPCSQPTGQITVNITSGGPHGYAREVARF